jgi:hypothetical protein
MHSILPFVDNNNFEIRRDNILENFTFIWNILRKFEIDLIIQNILNLNNSLWFVLKFLPDEEYIQETHPAHLN